MDANGTKYHLIYGLEDWQLCAVEVEGKERPLEKDWKHLGVEWDGSTNCLRLANVDIIRPPVKPHPHPLEIEARRGAGRDLNGTWYWIDNSEKIIRSLSPGQAAPTDYWPSRSARTAGDELFHTCERVELPPIRLSGLAVTTTNFLVVGVEELHGLLVFDLYQDNISSLLRWPANTPFDPWDIAAGPDGGVLVLDRNNRTYWVLDAGLRLAGETRAVEKSAFEGADSPGETGDEQSEVFPRAFHLSRREGLPALSPVSIEPGPDGQVLVLDTAPDRDYSLVYLYRGEELVTVFSLKNSVSRLQPKKEPDGTVHRDITKGSVAGQDFAYCPFTDQGPQPVPAIYVADRESKQVVAYTLKTGESWNGHPIVSEDRENYYLPLRRWDGRALVAAEGQVFYDYREEWVVLLPFVECLYEEQATLYVPATKLIAFGGSFDRERKPKQIPGGLFDSQVPGCTWHRLFLDATIRAETAVKIEARAADKVEYLENAVWIQQPGPYLRAGGAELPYYDPWGGPVRVPEGTGTWELLVQHVHGRYLQLRLTLSGTGRATPEIRAIRAWYPRFSYLAHYLPPVYSRDMGSQSFLERFLANFEGFYTGIEDKITGTPALFDPRSAPGEALDWLAGWLGLVLDSFWSDPADPHDTRRRLFIRHAYRLFQWRGTIQGLQMALGLYLNPLETLDDSFFEPSSRRKGTVEIVEWFEKLDLQGSENSRCAHRFSVLVPRRLTPTQLGVVRRIVELEKPVHTSFEIERLSSHARVGQAHVGLDLRLEEEAGEDDPVYLGSGLVLQGATQLLATTGEEAQVVTGRYRLGDLTRL